MNLVESLRMEAATCEIGIRNGSEEWREGMRLLGAKMSMAANRIAELEAQADEWRKDFIRNKTRANALEAEIREWAAYCRSCQPGPNIADTMLKFIGDPPHDYALAPQVPK